MSSTMQISHRTLYSLTFMDEAGYGIRAGSYRAYVNLEYEGQVWTLEQDFDIAPAQADTVNAAALNKGQQQAAQRMVDDAVSVSLNLTTLIIIGTVVLVLIIVAVAVPLIIRKRRISNEMLMQMQQRILELQIKQQNIASGITQQDYKKD